MSTVITGLASREGMAGRERRADGRRGELASSSGGEASAGILGSVGSWGKRARCRWTVAGERAMYWLDEARDYVQMSWRAR